MDTSAAKIHWVWRIAAISHLGDQSFDEQDRAIEAQKLIALLDPYCNAYVFQLQSSSTGSLYYQGYMELKQRKRHVWINRHICSMEFLTGALYPLTAWEYCSNFCNRKLGPWIKGLIPLTDRIGAPKMMKLFVDDCRKGLTDQQLWQKYPGMMTRYPHTPNRIRSSFDISLELEEKQILDTSLFYSDRLIFTLEPPKKKQKK